MLNSTPTPALLMPIVLALADRAGLREGSPGRIALALAVGLGTYELSASILPANVPNLIMTGAAEHAYGVQFNYLPYLELHAPVAADGSGIEVVLQHAMLGRWNSLSDAHVPSGVGIVPMLSMATLNF